MEHQLDKKLFYEHLKPFANKHLPIVINMPLNPHDVRYRLIFDWSSRKPNDEFNPIMYAQLLDTTKQGYHQYVVPDLIFNGPNEGVTTDYKLWLYLDQWIVAALASNGAGEGAE